MPETQLTDAARNHVLTNVGAWSHDGRWLYYDVRSALDGSVFDGARIERVHAETARVEPVHESRDGARCGVVTASPADDRVVFIQGPARPDDGWTYAAHRRRGVVLDVATGDAAGLDARDLTPPFTAGALRGGTHVHVFNGDATLISFTYEDAVLADSPAPGAALNQRNVGVSVLGRPVAVPATHPRNHNGVAFSVLVSRTTDAPTPGSDDIDRAYQDAWVGARGYRDHDGSRRRAIAFLGDVVTADGRRGAEVFLVELPEDLTRPGAHPLQGGVGTRPAPPAGVLQRRITRTLNRPLGGVHGPRHWPRSSPDGDRIAFLMRDDAGVTQLWLASPLGGPPRQLTSNPFAIESAFTWDPSGRRLACIAGGSVCTVDSATGETTRLTAPAITDRPLRPEACLFSPNGRQIAYARTVSDSHGRFNQLFVVDAQSP